MHCYMNFSGVSSAKGSDVNPSTMHKTYEQNITFEGKGVSGECHN